VKPQLTQVDSNYLSHCSTTHHLQLHCNTYMNTLPSRTYKFWQF